MHNMLFALIIFCAFHPAMADQTYVSCKDDSVKQKARSEELKNIEAADQADRPDNVLKPGAELRDRLRRERIGQIFGEGCINTAQDYANAALVFQHGDHPDQYWQVFVWSMRGLELGDARQKRMMALGLDRYLVSKNRKQLFASQGKKDHGDKCWCLAQVEENFPDDLRYEYMATRLSDQYKWIDQMNAKLGCAPAKQCKAALKPTPKGSVPGFW